MMKVEEIQQLVGRANVRGGWDIQRAPASIVKQALRDARGHVHIGIRADALDEYRANKGALPQSLKKHAHRLAQLDEEGKCFFKRRSRIERRGRHTAQANESLIIGVDDALPLHPSEAVSLLNRYPELLEPVDVGQPEPVKRPKSKSKSKGGK